MELWWENIWSLDVISQDVKHRVKTSFFFRLILLAMYGLKVASMFLS